jgi:MtrB/PioB family decaheme-associated outer membrane protein
MLSLAALVLVASAAQAQTATATGTDATATQVTTAPQPTTPFGYSGQVDFGIRGTDITGDQARFQRYRDIGDGGVLDRFRFNADGSTWILEAAADKVGRNDQRFWGEFLRVGKLRAEFSFDQLPTLYALDAKTPYTSPSTGIFKMDATTRARLAASPSNSRLGLAPLLSPVALDSSRDTMRFAVSASPNRELDIDVSFNSFARTGSMPWMAPFGFSNVVELPLPLDNRTNDLSMKAEWGNRNGMLRVGYDGSWFTNEIRFIEFDNPLAVTDRVYSSAYSDGRAPAYARMAMAPDSTQHMVSTAAAYRLPARTRVTGYFGIGSVKSDAEILPFTTNTAAPVLPLDRSNVDGDARIMSANLGFTSRPNRYVFVNARYRYYDMDNRTESFHSEQWINFDGALRTDPISTEPYSVKRQNVDVDVSLTPFAFGAVKVGYGRYNADRTHPGHEGGERIAARVFKTTVENVFRTSFDVTGNQYFSLRALFEHSVREGQGLDLELLEHVGEQPQMRHFDIANRDRDRVTALLTVMPNPVLGFSASIAAGTDDYKDLEFGLRDNDNRLYTVGADIVPNDVVAVGVSYSHERYTAVQLSRSANPLSPTDQGWLNPARNWNIDSEDTTDTFAANVELTKLIPRTDLRFGYDVSKGDATYVYNVGPALPAPQQLAPVTNELIRGTADVQYFLTRRVALGVVYWYDEYRVDDFALGPDLITNQVSLPSAVLLGYLYAPYKAHTGMLRVSVLW